MKVPAAPVRRAAAVLVACLITARGVSAAGPELALNGFGTLGVVHADLEDADFARSASLPRGAGASGAWSGDVDSVLGAQLTASFTPTLTGVVQVVAEYGYDNRFAPRVEWASLKFQATPELGLRVGRTALPAFMHSDSRKLHYAVPWVRPPVEIYDLVPTSSIDGVDALWQRPFGGGTNTAQAAFGGSTERYSNGGFGVGEASTNGQLMLADTWERGAFTVRVNYGTSGLSLPALDPLFDGFRQFGAAGEAIAARYEMRRRRVSYMGVGVGYDTGPWFVASEWGRIAVGAAIPGKNGAYAVAGLRRGSLTAYATAALSFPSEDSVPLQLDTSMLPAAAVPGARALNAGLVALRSSGPEQTSFNVGLRWDVLRDVAVKAQLDRVDLGPHSAGTLTFRQPGFVPGQRYHVLSLSVDFLL